VSRFGVAAKTGSIARYGKAVDPQDLSSARLCWRVPSEWVFMDPAPGREVTEALQRVFGAVPCRLSLEHLPVLRAMAVVGGAHYGRLAKLQEVVA
jgi:hypothetical protein